jgi:hypothetical protein
VCAKKVPDVQRHNAPGTNLVPLQTSRAERMTLRCHFSGPLRGANIVKNRLFTRIYQTMYQNFLQLRLRGGGKWIRTSGTVLELHASVMEARALQSPRS